MVEATIGLRERKKHKTREALAQAGAELFVQRGYSETTLADIADAAEVSTRTVFAYFGSKEDILFAGWQRLCDAFARALAERPESQDSIVTWRELVMSSRAEKAALDRKLDQVIAGDESLSSRYRARMVAMQEVLAAAIARDLATDPDDLRARLAAAVLAAGYGVLEQRERDGAVRTSEEIASVIDPVIAFARAGLEALAAPADVVGSASARRRSNSTGASRL
jgi:AcrR family transcriptional regulator